MRRAVSLRFGLGIHGELEGVLRYPDRKTSLSSVELCFRSES